MAKPTINVHLIGTYQDKQKFLQDLINQRGDIYRTNHLGGEFNFYSYSTKTNNVQIYDDTSLSRMATLYRFKNAHAVIILSDGFINQLPVPPSYTIVYDHQSYQKILDVNIPAANVLNAVVSKKSLSDVENAIYASIKNIIAPRDLKKEAERREKIAEKREKLKSEAKELMYNRLDIFLKCNSKDVIKEVLELKRETNINPKL